MFYDRNAFIMFVKRYTQCVLVNVNFYLCIRKLQRAPFKVRERSLSWFKVFLLSVGL